MTTLRLHLGCGISLYFTVPSFNHLKLSLNIFDAANLLIADAIKVSSIVKEELAVAINVTVRPNYDVIELFGIFLKFPLCLGFFAVGFLLDFLIKKLNEGLHRLARLGVAVKQILVRAAEKTLVLTRSGSKTSKLEVATLGVLVS